MNENNTIAVVGILALVSLAISIYGGLLAVSETMQGNPTISKGLGVISRTYLANSALGVVIFLFVIFGVLLLGKEYGGSFLHSSVISYAVLTAFLIFGSILFVVTVEAGLLTFSILSPLVGFSALVSVIQVVFFLLLAWIVYALLKGKKK